MIELDFRTNYTVVVPNDTTRGGASFAARCNHLIERALRDDGIVFKVTEGAAIPTACTTDVHRIECVSDDEEDGNG